MDNAVVSFRYDTASFTLNYPATLLGLSVTKLKTLFKYMVLDFDHHRGNADAVSTTHKALTDYAAETRQDWSEISKVFQDCYVDTKYHNCPDKRKAEANNKKLMAAVKSAKAKYDRAQKLLTCFEEVKAKYFD